MEPISLTAMQLGHLLGLVNRELMQLNSGVGLSCHICNFTSEVELPWSRCTHGRGPGLRCPSCGEPNRHWLRFGELEELYDRLSQTADTAN